MRDMPLFDYSAVCTMRDVPFIDYSAETLFVSMSLSVGGRFCFKMNLYDALMMHCLAVGELFSRRLTNATAG